MTTPPRPSLDYATLNVPPGAYVMPSLSECLYATGTDDTEAAQRITSYLQGTTPATDLQPEELSFLRQFFGEQAAERSERALTYFTNRVPRRYNTATPDQHASTWATSAVTNPDATRSLLIVGPTGTGKTHYAYGTLRAVAEAGSTGWRALTAADLYASLRPRTGRDTEAEFEKLAKTPVLFIDDLAAAKLTEWTEEITYRLINHRYEQCLPGIFTSNVPPAQLREALGERIASRLTEMCERLVLKGDDRRKAMAA